MLLNPSRLAIRHGHLTLYFLVLLLLGGFFALSSLGQDEDPPFNYRMMVIRAFWPGATAEQMVDQVGDLLEQTLQDVPYADEIRSYAKPGEISLIFQIKESSPPQQIQHIWYLTRKKIGDVWGQMPAGVEGPFINDEFGDVFGLIYALQGDGFDWQELEDTADDIRKSLMVLPDVSKIELFGKQRRYVYIEISQSRLATLGISVPELAAQLGQQNEVTPAGILQGERDQVHLRVSGRINRLDDLRSMPVHAGGRSVKLEDIGRVFVGFSDPPDPMVRVNGKPVVAIGISMRKGGDIIDLGEQLQAELDLIRASLPLGMELVRVQNQPEIVADSVGEFIQALIEALVIVLLVTFVTLGFQGSFRHLDWRPGVVVALAIPAVLAGTFLLMYVADIDLHKISLGALIISLGLLVDDAIIIIEMTVRKLEEGMDRHSAATFAYAETAMPMLTGTLITAVGFLPIGLANSSVGEYTFAIFAVTASTLLISWCMAVYFVPYIAYHLLQERGSGGQLAAEHDVYDTPFYRRLKAFIELCVERKWQTLAATGGAIVIGLLGLMLVEKQFFPESSRPEILVDLWLPEGSSMNYMRETTEQVEEALLLLTDTGQVSSFIGSGAPRFYLPMDVLFPQANLSQLIVEAKDVGQRNALLAEMQILFAEQFPDVRTRARLLPNGPPVPYPVQFRVMGPEPEQVRYWADQVREQMAADSDVQGLNDNWNEPIKILDLRLDQARARQLGASTASVANSGQALLSGIVIGSFLDGEDNVPIVLRQPVEERNSLTAIAQGYLPLEGGSSVPISHLVHSSLGWEPGVLWRHNRHYAITVQSDVSRGIQGDTVARRLDRQLDAIRQNMPHGYFIEIAGTVEQSQKGQDSINAWLPLMAALIFTLLMLQLRSVKLSLMMVITGPLGLIGAAWTLILLSEPLGFVAFLGVIAMSGMIIRNSVILVDQVEKDIQRGMSGFDAVVAAAVRRARPIFLTTITAVLAMIPLTTTSFWGPMAVAIMGGLIVATALTLFSLPALYAAVYKLHRSQGY